MSTPREAYDHLVGYIQKHGGVYANWYVGISADAKERLFSGHGVKEQGGYWATAYVEKSEDAREIELSLIRLGCEGGPGGGDNTARGLYVYKITGDTRQ